MGKKPNESFVIKNKLINRIDRFCADIAYGTWMTQLFWPKSNGQWNKVRIVYNNENGTKSVSAILFIKHKRHTIAWIEYSCARMWHCVCLWNTRCVISIDMNVETINSNIRHKHANNAQFSSSFLSSFVVEAYFIRQTQKFQFFCLSLSLSVRLRFLPFVSAIIVSISLLECSVLFALERWCSWQHEMECFTLYGHAAHSQKRGAHNRNTVATHSDQTNRALSIEFRAWYRLLYDIWIN